MLIHTLTMALSLTLPADRGAEKLKVGMGRRPGAPAAGEEDSTWDHHTGEPKPNAEGQDQCVSSETTTVSCPLCPE